MKFSDGMAMIEAILFACGEPIELEKIASAAEIEAETVAKMIKNCIEVEDGCVHDIVLRPFIEDNIP